MNLPQPSRARSLVRKPAKTRDGMVLVTVLMIVTLASMTAVYAVQGATVELRASGSMKSGMLVKATSESQVMVGAAAIDELRANGSWSAANPTKFARYRVPDVTPDGINRVGELTLETRNMVGEAIPTEADLRGPVGTPSAIVTPYVPDARAIQETWMRSDSSVGDPMREPVRVAVTIFGELNLQAGEAILSTQARELHSTVSISQAYYDATISQNAR